MTIKSKKAKNDNSTNSNTSKDIQRAFARKLADNDVNIRNQAFENVRIQLNKHTDTTLLDMQKLCKGLFYCMQMADTELVQENLADQISNLVSILSNEKFYLFVRAFFQIIKIEWNRIDNLRLNKYYMLIRRLVNRSIYYCLVNDLSDESKNLDYCVSKNFSSILKEVPLESTVFNCCTGLALHIISIFYDELVKLSIEVEKLEINHKIKFDQLIIVLEPFYKVLFCTQVEILRERVCRDLFQPISTLTNIPKVSNGIESLSQREDFERKKNEFNKRFVSDFLNYFEDLLTFINKNDSNDKECNEATEFEVKYKDIKFNSILKQILTRFKDRFSNCCVQNKNASSKENKASISSSPIKFKNSDVIEDWKFKKTARQLKKRKQNKKRKKKHFSKNQFIKI